MKVSSAWLAGQGGEGRSHDQCKKEERSGHTEERIERGACKLDVGADQKRG